MRKITLKYQHDIGYAIKKRASESKDGHPLKVTKYKIMHDTAPDDKLSWEDKNYRYEQENEVYHLSL